MRVDDDGIHLSRRVDGSVDVLFDGWRGWSVNLADKREVPTTVFWPKRLRAMLDGSSLVTVVMDERELFSGEVSFGSGQGRVALVDRRGSRVFVDKWGLVQRPFETRRESGGVEAMAQMADHVLEVMREGAGLEGWVSFGTLLGAARDGKVIGHDSDIDLCYLSERETPAEMMAELWDLARVLTDAGIRVMHRSGSFLTVLHEAPDGATDGIDIYICFYVGDLLHETATVRAAIPREAVLPLRMLEFEGREVPAPADPDVLLTASYGPSWRVPDPSFRHRPGPEIKERFSDWFGSSMLQRREWRARNVEDASQPRRVSGFARWVSAQLASEVHTLELGAGTATDLRFYAAQHAGASGYDFAMPGRKVLEEHGVPWPDNARRQRINFLEERDVITSAALAARGAGPRAVVARRLMETLPPVARDRVWTFASMALRGGGSCYLEGVALSRASCAARQADPDQPQYWPVDPNALALAAEAAGGRVVHREGFVRAARAVRGGPDARWRMVVEWGRAPGAATSTTQNTIEGKVQE